MTALAAEMLVGLPPHGARITYQGRTWAFLAVPDDQADRRYYPSDPLWREITNPLSDLTYCRLSSSLGQRLVGAWQVLADDAPLPATSDPGVAWKLADDIVSPADRLARALAQGRTDITVDPGDRLRVIADFVHALTEVLPHSVPGVHYQVAVGPAAVHRVPDVAVHIHQTEQHRDTGVLLRTLWDVAEVLDLDVIQGAARGVHPRVVTRSGSWRRLHVQVSAILDGPAPSPSVDEPTAVVGS